MSFMRRWWGNRKGSTAIEYGILAAMVALVALGGFSNLFNSVKLMYDNNSNRAIDILKQ